MIDRRPWSSRRRRVPPRGGHRAPRAWHDPALWAWVAVAVFALLPLSHAVASPALASATDVAAERADQASAAGGGTP
jgi:hypothetical protein